MLDALANCVRWSETVAVRFPETDSDPGIFLKNVSN